MEAGFCAGSVGDVGNKLELLAVDEGGEPFTWVPTEPREDKSVTCKKYNRFISLSRRLTNYICK